MAGELGYPGLVLFLILWFRWFQIGGSFLFSRSPDPMRRIGIGIFFGVCGIFLQSLTEWVFRHSPHLLRISYHNGCIGESLLHPEAGEKDWCTIIRERYSNRLKCQRWSKRQHRVQLLRAPRIFVRTQHH